MKYNLENIGKIIKSEREKLGWSQEKLGKKLFISGKQISMYEHGSLPPLGNLLNLCEEFDCELGYLLGEPKYSKGSQLYTKIFNSIGLSNEAIDTLNHITGSNSKFPFEYKINELREILNAFICSDNFTVLLDALYQLYSCGDEISNLNKDLNKKYDDETIQKAFDAEFGTNDYEHDNSLPELSPEVINAKNEMNKIIDKEYSIQYQQKIARYEINEAFIMLINEIFDNKGNLM